jgi:hypothetical protein
VRCIASIKLRTKSKNSRSIFPTPNPYDVEPDRDDNIWVATDNHILKFDPRSKKFARYPVTTRTDIPKLAVTRDGAVWFGPRNAGQSGGYGGALTALYPDKDAIRSYAAFYADDNTRNRKARNEWALIPVRGERVLVPAAPRNPWRIRRNGRARRRLQRQTCR